MSASGLEAGYDELWGQLKAAIRKQKVSGENPDEYLVFTTLQQSRCNRIRVYDEHFIRVSDGANSAPQTITKSDVIEIARWAIEAPNRRFSIKDPGLKPARMGSIVCTMLALLPDFEYLPGQVLVYSGR